jgi:nucleoside-diphosphate kinase
MAIERTLGIIKPDAVARGLSGRILAQIEAAGLELEALRLLQLSREQAEAFYAVHRHRPFFRSLCEFMSSGPCVPIVLKGEGAIERYRALMGATDPRKATANTLRALFGTDVERNAVHGSDAPATAATEIEFFRAALSRWI